MIQFNNVNDVQVWLQYSGALLASAGTVPEDANEIHKICDRADELLWQFNKRMENLNSAAAEQEKRQQGGGIVRPGPVPPNMKLTT